MSDSEASSEVAKPFVVGIGASAGGVETVGELLSALPLDTGMVFIVVQHLDPNHESELPSLWQARTKMPVAFATDGAHFLPDHVYVIPPATKLSVEGTKLRVVPLSDTPGLKLPIDHLFRSMADHLGTNAVAVVLTGGGSDGALGVQNVKAVGGIVFAQDERSARFSAMPRAALGTGCVDFGLPTVAIARELTKISRHPYVTHPGLVLGVASPNEHDSLSRILRVLRSASGVDFTSYKQTTIRRRIWRRMALHKVDDLEAYLKLLRGSGAEAEALFQDLLIKVTSFFRDPETFEALKRTVLPTILRDSPPSEGLRIWVPGCSTGEEVYSLAITVLEYMNESGQHRPIHIFATDISDWAIERARAGVYPENVVLDVSPERLRWYFTKNENSYHIAKSIRDLCIFAKQNLVNDPPFSRLDLISCRNVLIYFDAALQKKVMPIFHYALRPNGFLMLGNSETIGSFTDLYLPVDKIQRIYAKKAGAARLQLEFGQHSAASFERVGDTKKAGIGEEMNRGNEIQREADRILMSRYVPAGVLIDGDFEIIQFRGRTSRFLEPAQGAPSHNLMKMAREGLLVDLRSSVQKAKLERVAVRREGARVKIDDVAVTVNFEVIPVKSTPNGEAFFLVLFEEVAPAAASEQGAPAAEPGEPDAEVTFLRQELEATKAYLQSIIVEQEATNEELKSANEEILSSNEELQSTNEELETAKEELQSTNEELTTVNEELQNRNSDLMIANNDLNNLLASVNIAVVMLDIDLRIRRFTPLAERLLRIIPADVGRLLSDITPIFVTPSLQKLLTEVTETMNTREQDVQDRDGRWYSLRLRPYRTSENKIDGVVMVLVDIDALKRGQDRILRTVIESISKPTLLLGDASTVLCANSAYYARFGMTPAATEGMKLARLGDGQWSNPKLRTMLEEVLPKSLHVEDFEVPTSFPALKIETLRLSASQILPDENEKSAGLILLVVEEIK